MVSPKRWRAVSVAAVAVLAACTRRPPTSPGSPPGAPTVPGSGQTSSPSGAASSSGPDSAVAFPEAREPTEDEKKRHLPELEVEYVGMHVGGGPNDAAGKAPFERALAAQRDALASCYRQVDDPEHGGTFGVDLFIGRDGGHPTVRQVRTRLKGDAFSACMVNAFEAASFDKPKKGPTQISYSLRFSLRGLR